MKAKKQNRYEALIETIFLAHYKKGSKSIAFTREELLANTDSLGIQLPKKPGDILYSFRYRNPLPPKILATQPKGKEWVIEGKGRAMYELVWLLQAGQPVTARLDGRLDEDAPEIDPTEMEQETRQRPRA